MGGERWRLLETSLEIDGATRLLLLVPLRLTVVVFQPRRNARSRLVQHEELVLVSLQSVSGEGVVDVDGMGG